MQRYGSYPQTYQGNGRNLTSPAPASAQQTGMGTPSSSPVDRAYNSHSRSRARYPRVPRNPRRPKRTSTHIRAAVFKFHVSAARDFRYRRNLAARRSFPTYQSNRWCSPSLEATRARAVQFHTGASRQTTTAAEPIVRGPLHHTISNSSSPSIVIPGDNRTHGDHPSESTSPSRSAVRSR